jgi:hypothetical protein
MNGGNEQVAQARVASFDMTPLQCPHVSGICRQPCGYVLLCIVEALGYKATQTHVSTTHDDTRLHVDLASGSVGLSEHRHAAQNPLEQFMRGSNERAP